VTTAKIADGSVTANKLAAGVIPTSLAPSGNAGGDLAGNIRIQPSQLDLLIQQKLLMLL
jgi:hypothetical protein